MKGKGGSAGRGCFSGTVGHFHVPVAAGKLVKHLGKPLFLRLLLNF
jgi:hypothetical protein